MGIELDHEQEQGTACGAGTRERPLPAGRPLYLIHTTNSPKQATARVSGRFGGSRLVPVVHGLRALVYLPLKVAMALPLGPVQYAWLMRQTLSLDAPLRAYMLGAYAKT